MLTVVAWNDLFWVALRVCKISGLSGLSFPRFRLRAPRLFGLNSSASAVTRTLYITELK